MSRRYVILLAYVLILSVGCSEPGTISINPPPLTGDYEGVYSVTHNWGDSVLQFTNWNNILWTFDDSHYYFRIDPSRHTGHCFCAVTGQYAMCEGFLLETINAEVDTEVGCSECDVSEAPWGVFVRETKGDSLILRRQADSVHMEMRLLRIR